VRYTQVPTPASQPRRPPLGDVFLEFTSNIYLTGLLGKDMGAQHSSRTSNYIT